MKKSLKEMNGWYTIGGSWWEGGLDIYVERGYVIRGIGAGYKYVEPYTQARGGAENRKGDLTLAAVRARLRRGTIWFR